MPNSPLLAGEGQGERFACASELQRGEELIKKLQEPGKERIRELVRNPLRLSLLCQTSYLLPMDEPLPETKAALYERFTRYFYEWKQEQHLDLSQQDELIDELHEALGKLALAGINSATRFRLERKFARQQMGDRLFKLVERLNWLVLVDRKANTDEAVYAFFHPTFQEYFAACAIDDWHFFLNHVPDNPMQGNYRIFEPKWKEVILLWLGRQEEELRAQKEQFIQALVEFKDGCEQGFYEYRAYFLAAAGITEFVNCSLTDEILEQVVKWGFGYFNIRKQKWIRFFKPIEERARATLLETNQIRAIVALVDLIQNSQDEYTRLLATYSLGKIGKNNLIAITALVELIQVSQDENIRNQAVFSLEEIANGNQTTIVALSKLVQNCQEKNLRRLAALGLGKIDKCNSTAIAALVELIQNHQDEKYCISAACNLGDIDKGNPVAIAALVKLIQNSQNEDIRWQAALDLNKVDEDNPLAITASVELIQKLQDEPTRIKVVDALLEVYQNNPTARKSLDDEIQKHKDKSTRRQATYSLRESAKDNSIENAALVELIKNFQNEAPRWRALDSFKNILAESQMAEVIIALKNYLSNENYRNDFGRFHDCYQIIWHYAQTMPYLEFYQAWHQTTIHEGE